MLALVFPLAASQVRQHTESAIVLPLHAPSAQFLPLFGPVREAEWSHGWEPQHRLSGRSSPNRRIGFHHAHKFPAQRDHWGHAINARVKELAK